MTTYRKTRAQREQQFAAADREAWNSFSERLAALITYADALKLLAEAPPPDSPGRRYYSNLGFFLQQFSIPGGSSPTERALYAGFIERLDAAGELKPGIAKLIATALRQR